MKLRFALLGWFACEQNESKREAWIFYKQFRRYKTEAELNTEYLAESAWYR